MPNQTYLIKKILGPRASHGGGDGNYSRIEYEVQFESDEDDEGDQVVARRTRNSEALAPMNLSRTLMENREEKLNQRKATWFPNFEVDLENLPIHEKLAALRKRKPISQIRDIASRSSSRRSFPLLELPSTTRNLPTKDKIAAPSLANQNILYTRGIICEKLNKQRPKTFVNEDPYNNFKVLKSKYNALHDPSTWSYFAKPKVQKHLIKQGLLTPQGNVVCSLAEYNEYRKYLNNTVYIDQFKESIGKIEKVKNAQREQTRLLTICERAQTPCITNLEQRTEHAKEVIEKRQKEAMTRYKEKQQIKLQRLAKHEEEMERKRIKRVEQNEEKEKLRLARIQEIKNHEMEIRVQKLKYIQSKEKAAIARKEMEFTASRNRKGEESLKWFEKRLEHQCEQEVKEEIIEVAQRKDLLKKAEIRQQKIEDWRARLNEIQYEIQEEKASEAISKRTRSQELHEKYYEKWNNYIEKQRKKGVVLSDPVHQSSFHTMQDIIKDLQDKIEQEMGREKREDSIDDLYADFPGFGTDNTFSGSDSPCSD